MEPGKVYKFEGGGYFFFLEQNKVALETSKDVAASL